MGLSDYRKHVLSSLGEGREDLILNFQRLVVTGYRAGVPPSAIADTIRGEELANC